jgi:FKBP-type peptidyl-prolyl cis-trans isomerase SlyD
METIKKDKVIAVQYTLHVMVDGQEELVEQTTPAQPFQFLFGAGLMLDAFEMALLNKKAGDTFDIHIPCDQAYLEAEDEMIIKVSKSIFEDEDGNFSEEVIKNAVVNLEDEEGNLVPAIVLSVDAAKDGMVEIDTNHPLAGYDLHFVGAVESVRVATKEEMKNPEMLMDLPFED